jgi:folate-dependent tRNA-U54 methylase TrmFO/GidA
MIKPIVMILEDSPFRIKWFKTEFPNVDCIWAKNVSMFFEMLQSIDKTRLRLIILDHDLGDDKLDVAIEQITGHEAMEFDDAVQASCVIDGGTWPMDINGQNGMSAVDGLVSWNDIPTIVWSVNSVCAPLMVKRLNKQGSIAAWIPFQTHLRWRLRAAIASQVE